MTKKTKITSVLFLFLMFMESAFCESITFSAEKMSGVSGDKNSSTVLKGNAKVETSNMKISADSIELYGKEFRYIKAEGKVKGSNTETKMDFSCAKLVYDRETKIVSLENEVQLNDLENNVKASAEIMSYDQNKEIAIMQIKVKITQKNNNCTCAYSIYKKNEQILEMSGNPKIIQDDDTFRAQNITLDLNSQEITLSGRVKGSVTTESKNKEGENNE